MYQAVYKCRLCGEKIVQKETNKKDYAKEKVRISCLYTNDFYDMVNARAVRMKSAIPHKCKDGSFGLADFQGFKKVED